MSRQIVVRMKDGTERGVPVDDDGFLLDLKDWSKEFAEAAAKEEEIVGPLTSDHWKLIDFLRAHYAKHQGVPSVVECMRGTGMNVRQLNELFPTGPGKGAVKIAGLPKPIMCAP